MKSIARQLAHPVETDTAPPLVPDGRLYIYYFKGRLEKPFTDSGPRFLGNWEEADCFFLFFSAPAETKINELLAMYPGITLADTFDMSYQEWQPMTGFPLTAGGFSIFPPWVPPPTMDDTPLILDPGLVFGSGFHATTHDCLEALEQVCYNSQNIKTAIDIGTGSGLLAVAAALHGVGRIIGLDNNFLAAKTAGHNVRLNHVDDRVLIVKGSALTPVCRKTDLLMANIHYEVMKVIVESSLFLDSRWFILSGLLRTPAEKIISRLENSSAEIIKIWNSDGIWYTVLGQHRGG